MKDGTINIFTSKNKSTRRIDISNNKKLLLKSYDVLFDKFYKKVPLKD